MQKNILQKTYGWIGFVVFWSLALLIVWSMFHQDQTIATLVRVVGAFHGQCY